MNLRLPYPPSTNEYWRHNRGRTHISKAGEQYRHNVLAAVYADGIYALCPLKGRLKIVVRATMPDKRKRDVDNLFKALLDAMEHAGVFANDNQVDDLRIVRGQIKPPGWLDVTIEEL